MSGHNVVKLFELAPDDVQHDVGLTSRNRDQFAANYDAHPSVEIMALALFYACRATANVEKAAPIIADMKIDAIVLHSLIGMVSAEEFSDAHSLFGEVNKAAASKRATAAVKSRHQKENSSHQKAEAGREKIRAEWKTGKYKTKQLCAEEEYEGAGISYDTALKALRNI